MIYHLSANFVFGNHYWCLLVFSKVLVANRGEIAVRIIRACRELGIKCATIYSSIDKNSLHVKLADEAYEIGPPDPLDSYLAIDKIINLALRINADAIHPGYGFLSENPRFAKECEKNGIIFIGPKSSVLALTGNKLKARSIVAKAGVPIIPGTLRHINDSEEAVKIANRLGYPVVLKPVDGGGGIGMRVVRNARELRKKFEDARLEAFKAFGSDKIYIEKVIPRAKHIEMQIISDNYGNLVWIGERECSIQRRHQKLLEETPSPALNEEERRRLGELATKVAQTINYNNIGTVEFLFDGYDFYFLEVNARLQVEHGITEITTGIDLVQQQLLIAAGEEIKLKQGEIERRGWAMEVRITAEDPLGDFAPSPGKIVYYKEPGGMGIRVDSYLYPGYQVPPYYDALVAKLISWGRTREEAIRRMRRGLSEFVIGGIRTTIPLLRKIINSKEFLDGTYTTTFLQDNWNKFKQELIEEENKRLAALVASMIITNNIDKIDMKINKPRSKPKRDLNVSYVIHQLNRWTRKLSPWRKASFYYLSG